MEYDSFSRTGWPFPVRFDGTGANLEEISYIEDIEESLRILLKTLPGQRIAHPLYGCDLTPFFFRSITPQLMEGIRHTVEVAIIRYEARIRILSVEVSPHLNSPFQLDINIAYKLQTASSRYNITIPFYTMEKES